MLVPFTAPLLLPLDLWTLKGFKCWKCCKNQSVSFASLLIFLSNLLGIFSYDALFSHLLMLETVPVQKKNLCLYI